MGTEKEVNLKALRTFKMPLTDFSNVISYTIFLLYSFTMLLCFSYQQLYWIQPFLCAVLPTVPKLRRDFSEGSFILMCWSPCFQGILQNIKGKIRGKEEKDFQVCKLDIGLIAARVVSYAFWFYIHMRNTGRFQS